MLEYEAAAYQSLCKLREKHDVDIVVMRQNILNSYHVFTLSKKCCEIRDSERRHFAVKEYLRANELRI